MIRALTKREGLILFSCEGDKPKDNLRKVHLTNSNPGILGYFAQWLETFHLVPHKSMKLRLHLWRGSNEARAKTHWSNGLGISLDNSAKKWFKPRGTNNKHPNVICRVSFSSTAVMESAREDIAREFYPD